MFTLFAFKDAVTICTLGIGTAFGESILDNTPRHATIVTREFSELLRIEQKEFRTLWEVGKSSLIFLYWSILSCVSSNKCTVLYIHSLYKVTACAGIGCCVFNDITFSKVTLNLYIFKYNFHREICGSYSFK